MLSYLTSFIFYTLGMIGILLIGFIAYKKFSPIEKGDNKGTIKILDSLPIGNKKVLLVVKIKNEKFLIASGLEHTTFLSKLDDEIQTSKKSIKIQSKTNANNQQTLQYQNIQNMQNLQTTQAIQAMQNMQAIQNTVMPEKSSQNSAQAWQNIQQGVKNVEVENLNNFRSVIQSQIEQEEQENQPIQSIHSEQIQQEQQHLQKPMSIKAQYAQSAQMQIPTEEIYDVKTQQDDLKALRLQKLQKKFDDLYYKDEVVKMTSPIEKDNTNNIMQKLLKELSSETNYKSENYKTGNVING